METIKSRTKKSDLVLLALFLFYAFTVIWFTVLKRSTNVQAAQFEVFWSYQKWFAGDWDLGIEILGNVAMFMPFGFLLAGLCHGKGKIVLIIISAILFSLTIETSQLLLMRGMFEWDDLISNGLGAILGCLMYGLAERIIARDKFPTIVLSTGVFCALICVGVYIIGRGGVEEVDYSSKVYCFQIDEAEVDDGHVTLTGFAFRYERKVVPVSLVLQSTSTGERINLDVRQTMRPDVNEYFLCEYDYESTGFVATGEANPAEEYEVLIRWPWSVAVSTGVYVTGENVHYAAENDFIAPEVEHTDLERIVENGVLRAFQPEDHYWVYQYEGALYWIADSAFAFDDDGTTFIQYQLTTTQTQKLPAYQVEYNQLWENIGAYFEANELTGSFGAYRVMRREIPTKYSITSIFSGHFQKGEWIWRHHFRPYYVF